MSSRSGQGKDRQKTLAYNSAVSGGIITEDALLRRIHQGNFFTWHNYLTSWGSFATYDIGIGVNGPSEQPAGPVSLAVRFRAKSANLTSILFELYRAPNASASGSFTSGFNHNRNIPPSIGEGKLPNGIVPTWAEYPNSGEEFALIDPSIGLGASPTRIGLDLCRQSGDHIASDWWILSEAEGVDAGMWYVARWTNIEAGAIPLAAFWIDYFFVDRTANR